MNRFEDKLQIDSAVMLVYESNIQFKKPHVTLKFENDRIISFM